MQNWIFELTCGVSSFLAAVSFDLPPLVVYQLEFVVPMNLESSVKLFCIQIIKMLIIGLRFMDTSTSAASKLYHELMISKFFISLVTSCRS